MKKIYLFIAIMCLILANFNVYASSQQPEYDFSDLCETVFAENFDYGQSEGENLYFSQRVFDGGQGFFGKWAADNSDYFSVPLLVNNTPVVSRNSNGTFLKNQSQAEPLYRKLKNKCVFKDGYDYYFKIKESDITIDNQKNLNWSISLGEKLSFGLSFSDAPANGYYTVLEVGGKKIVGTQKISPLKIYDYEIHIKINENSEDTVELLHYNDMDEKPLTYELSASTELSGDYFDYVKVSSGPRIINLYNIEMKAYNTPKLEIFNELISKMKNKIADEKECAALLQGYSFMGKSEDYDVLMDYISENNFDITKNVLVYSDIENNGVYDIENIEEVKFEFCYNLCDTPININLSGEDGELECSYDREGNIIIVRIISKLNAGEKYTLSISNVFDFKNESVDDTVVDFYTDVFPVVNIENDAVYMQNEKQIEWNEIEKVNIEAILKNEENEIEIKNGDYISLYGNCILTLKISSEFSNKEKSYSFFVTENYNSLKIKDYSEIYNKLFYENFDYDEGTFLENYDCMGGEGFDGYWSADCVDFQTHPITVDSTVPSIRKNNYGTFLVDWGSQQQLYRKLKNKVDFSENKDYYFYAIEGDSTAENANLNWKIQLGNTGIYFGQKINDSGYCAQLSDGKNVYLTSEYYPSTYIYRYKLHIKTDSYGIDTVELKIWGYDENEPDEYNLSCSTELSEKSFDYVNVESGERCMQLYNFQMCVYNRELTEDFENTMNLIKDETAGVNDCINAYGALSYIKSQYPDYYDIINEYVSKKQWNRIVNMPKITGCNVADNGVYSRNEVQNIQIAFSDKLLDSKVSLLKGNETVQSKISLVDNTVTLTPDNKLDYDTNYTLVIKDTQDIYQRTAADEMINFYISFIPDMNINENSSYSQYKILSWDDSFTYDVSVVINNKSETQIVKNNSPMNLIGDIDLKITAVHNGKEQEKNLKFSLTEAYAPCAQNVTIEGIAATGSTLNGKYDYIDLNLDTEKNSKFQWFKCETVDGEYKKIENADKTTYTLSEYDENMYIMFGVIPCSDSDYLKEGAIAFSKPFVGAFAPTAKNIRIEQSGINNVLCGYYDYFDQNGDESKGSNCYWTFEGEDTILSDTSSVNITSAMNGRNIVFHVITGSIQPPYKGIECVSQPYCAYYSNTQSSYGGGGGGGGSNSYSASSSGSNAYSNTVLQKEEKEEKEDDFIFADVKNHWAKQYIEKAYKNGIVKGVNESSFEPDRTVKRCEFLAMIMRNDKSVKEYNNEFSDVISSDWYSKYIASALEKNIISKDKMFRPNESITREEMCKIVSVYLCLSQKEDLKKNDFSVVSPWAVEYVEKCLEAGMISGDENGNILPRDSLTRAQAATVAVRILELKGGSDK